MDTRKTPDIALYITKKKHEEKLTADTKLELSRSDRISITERPTKGDTMKRIELDDALNILSNIIAEVDNVPLHSSQLDELAFQCDTTNALVIETGKIRIVLWSDGRWAAFDGKTP